VIIDTPDEIRDAATRIFVAAGTPTLESPSGVVVAWRDSLSG